ncbi:unnamed protein product [Alopecurus aequalis]
MDWMEYVQEPAAGIPPSPWPVLDDLGTHREQDLSAVEMEAVQEEPGVSLSPLPVLVHHPGTEDGSQKQYSVSTQALSTLAVDELRRYRCFETPQGWIGATDWDSCTYEITMDLDGKIRPRTNIAKRHGIAAVGGKIYFVLNSCELGVIEFNNGNEGPKIDTIEVDMVGRLLSMPMASTYLVESRGELFLVVIFFDGYYNVHKIAKHAVYKMDFSKQAWCDVDEIGADRVFLLGGDMAGISCFGASCSAGGGLRGNCIYFLNHVAIEESFLHVIDLKKGTGQVQRPFRHNGYDMPSRSPFWLLPRECTFQAQGSSALPCSLRRHAKIGLFTFSCIFLFFVFLFRTM